ncbi:hypothetical protein CDD81_3224 [Ophiocordyceps australis]|uniref:Uncharacterized protein n=1 Tax=Ophiocordyceps australis TaxID=1399860 RepID=A0A2C5XXH9_9HYPO|nr:hypothetical protein CDD81_3224 [Ophiocordyceps australis]
MTTALYSCSQMLDHTQPVAYNTNTIFETFDPAPWFAVNHSTRGSNITASLPAELRITIAKTMGWEASTFIHRLDTALDHLPNAEQITKWYTRPGRRVCWTNNPKPVFDTHSTVASALADLLVQPRDIAKGLPAKRFDDLPPGYLAARVPHCLAPNDAQYGIMRRLIAKLKRENRERIVIGTNLEGFRRAARGYAHEFLRAVYHASHKGYTCAAGMNCSREWKRNGDLGDVQRVFVPYSFDHFLQILQRSLSRAEPVCIVFEKADVPAGYGALLGKQ